MRGVRTLELRSAKWLFPAHTAAFTVENVGTAYAPPRVTLLPSLGFSWSIE